MTISPPRCAGGNPGLESSPHGRSPNPQLNLPWLGNHLCFRPFLPTRNGTLVPCNMAQQYSGNRTGGAGEVMRLWGCLLILAGRCWQPKSRKTCWEVIINPSESISGTGLILQVLVWHGTCSSSRKTYPHSMGSVPPGCEAHFKLAAAKWQVGRKTTSEVRARPHGKPPGKQR